ncbi:hypothetical protein CEUSTIGMA_g11877.t1 [Chlamydomonas eustigma]|uniref:Protein kinase domain-containing protein n=1 Tax=Chlamydomonas eustigma TaxID=1157962 RepID=A0A250XN13_9CHLO|nr:hypothetical protein CEUSTIGMA_g11877.t1 [Chlamydomonas eustigma]|eukprot:GAX84457.1 hypothetical protein CEUSTIGMA_g11877.t1 [Chlamydomonas eustigma]
MLMLLLGCIAAEMVTGGPVFCGKSHVDQLQVILDCFGALPRRLMAPCVEAIDDKRLRVPSALEVKGIKAKLRKDTPQALSDFIMSCLQLDPLKRPSAEELLHLPHFQDGTSGTAFAKTFKKSPISSPVQPTPDRVLHSLTGSSNVNSVHYKGEPVPTRFNKIREEEENGHPGQAIQHSEKTGKAAGVRALCLPEKASQTAFVKDMDSFVRARGVSDCGALKSTTAGACGGVLNRVKVTVLATGASPAAGLIAAHRCSLFGVEAAAAAAAPASVVPPGAPLLAPGAFSGTSPSRRLTGSQQAQPRRRFSQQGSVTGANSSARETSNSCSLYTSLQILPPGTTLPRSKDSFQQQGLASGLTSAQDSLAGDASCHNSNAGRASRSLSPLPPLPLTPSTNVREGSFTSSQIRHMGFRRISTSKSSTHTLFIHTCQYAATGRTSFLAQYCMERDE